MNKQFMNRVNITSPDQTNKSPWKHATHYQYVSTAFDIRHYYIIHYLVICEVRRRESYKQGSEYSLQCTEKEFPYNKLLQLNFNGPKYYEIDI